MTALLPLLSLLDDSDAEVRAQAAKVLGDRRYGSAYDGLIKLLNDASPRTRFFAAMSLGKLGRREALPAIYAMLRENADQDPYLRHAGVMALTWIGDTDALLAAAKASSSAVRMAALLAMRRLHRDEIAVFLNDTDPAIVLDDASKNPTNTAWPAARPQPETEADAEHRVPTQAGRKRCCAACSTQVSTSARLKAPKRWPRLPRAPTPPKTCESKRSKNWRTGRVRPGATASSVSGVRWPRFVSVKRLLRPCRPRWRKFCVLRRTAFGLLLFTPQAG